MSIKSELSVLKVNIQNAKDKLYSNLVDKGVTDITTASTLDAMADSVSGITTGGGSEGGDLKLQLDDGVKIVEYADWISYVDTSNVTNMNSMFKN